MIRFVGPIVLGLIVILRGTLSIAGDWPQFRGSDRSGVSNEIDIPWQWSATENILWQVELPGPGSSSPITFGDQVYITCYSGYGLDLKSPGEL